MPQPQMLNQQSGFCCEEILHSFVEDGASDSYWVSFCARTLFCTQKVVIYGRGSKGLFRCFAEGNALAYCVANSYS